MIAEADVLAYCRTGLDAEEIISILSAITGLMSVGDPVCIALDAANDALMSLQEAKRESADAMGRHLPSWAERQDQVEGVDRMGGGVHQGLTMADHAAAERRALGKAIGELVSGFGALA